MKKLQNLFIAFFLFTGILSAQETQDTLWTRGAAIGLDFSQLLQINPRQGAGENRIGFGGALNYFANYSKERVSWDNKASLNLGIVRLGSGLVAVGGDKKPLQKSIDELRFNSKFGYKTSETSKFSYAADFSFLSQLLGAYSDEAGANQNLLSEPDVNGTLLSQLFAPAHITLSVGIDYKPTEKLSIYYSPIAYKNIIVLNDDIASREAVDADGVGLGASVHGNEWNSTTDYKKSFNQFGSLLRMSYADKLWNDRITWTSGLALYSNYLNKPQNIDVDWNNEFAVTIFKGIQVSLLTNVFYDHDVFVQLTDRNSVGGVNGLGRRVSFTQQLLIKYAHQF